MKTSGTTDAVLPLTKKQKCACNIVMGGLMVTAGVILVLAGNGYINAPVSRIAAPTILLGFGIAVLLSALIARNSLSMWFAGVVLSCGATSLLEVLTAADYGNLFPVYIAAPGIGCVFSVWFAENKFPLIKAILFFCGLAVLFFMGSFGVCGWGLACGLIAAFCGTCVIAIAIENYMLKDSENNA